MSKPCIVHICSFLFIAVRFSPCNIVYMVGIEFLKLRVQKSIIALSDAKLRSIHGKPYSDRPEVADGDGFGVRISPKCVITFQYEFRRKG